MNISGYHGKVLHIDVGQQTTRVEELSENTYRTYAGGGLLGTYFMLRYTKGNLDAYDPEVPLLFVSSVIAGLEGPGLARFSVVTKSPLSQGIAEARCEGPWGRALKGSGYDAILIHGQANKPIYIVVENGNVSFEDASELWGLTTDFATDRIEEVWGTDEVSVAAIGPAGEKRVRYASIVTSRSIQAMRMGVGAVMGSKRVKALVLKGIQLPSAADPALLQKIGEQFVADMASNQLSMWQKSPPGFAAWIDLADEETAYMGVHYFRRNVFDAGDAYTRERFQEFYHGESPCPGCSNDCIKLLHPDPEAGDPRSSGIHQEVSGTLGPLIGNRDLRTMLEANRLCNLYGMDPVSTGMTIGFAVECAERGWISDRELNGYRLSFEGNWDLLGLIRNIALREGCGDWLAEGVKRASERIGEHTSPWALHVKGIEMVPFDPRAQTNLGLGFATAPIGPRYDICEHDWDFDTVAGWSHTLRLSRTLGILERVPMQEVSRSKVKNYKALNTIWSACDALDLCVFASAPTRLLDLNQISELIRAITGWETSSYEFMSWGERRNHLMRIYNIREGLGAEEDRLPELFYQDPIPDGRMKGTYLLKDAFQDAIITYYRMMGWDDAGIPTEETLLDAGLGEWVGQR
jgi:aldehyde:ferredoxin oxidoreductase